MEREQKLYDAAGNGNLDVVKELLKSTFVDPTPPENLHFTPLMEAGNTYFYSQNYSACIATFTYYFYFCSWKRTQRSG